MIYRTIEHRFSNSVDHSERAEYLSYFMSYGCTREVAKHERSVRVARGDRSRSSRSPFFDRPHWLRAWNRLILPKLEQWELFPPLGRVLSSYLISMQDTVIEVAAKCLFPQKLGPDPLWSPKRSVSWHFVSPMYLSCHSKNLIYLIERVRNWEDPRLLTLTLTVSHVITWCNFTYNFSRACMCIRCVKGLNSEILVWTRSELLQLVVVSRNTE